MMCSACAERDAPFGRDACLRHVGGTRHITATNGSNVTFPIVPSGLFFIERLKSLSFSDIMILINRDSSFGNI